MSKYIVLYTIYQRVNVSSRGRVYIENAKEESHFSDTNYLSMEDFDDEQKAVKFALQNNGVILIPAQIESKIVKPKAYKAGQELKAVFGGDHTKDINLAAQARYAPEPKRTKQ